MSASTLAHNAGGGSRSVKARRNWPAWIDACNPATGEGIPQDATPEELREVLRRAIKAGEESGFGESFDLDRFMMEMHGNRENPDLPIASTITSNAEIKPRES